MEQRFSLLTLAVDDLAASTAFYEALGWRRSARQAEGVAFFQCGGVGLALFPRAELAKDAGISPDSLAGNGMAIAYNTRSRAEVDKVLAEAQAAGAQIVKPAQETFWGGYAGYFRCPAGHLWEVAWNEGFPWTSRATSACRTERATRSSLPGTKAMLKAPAIPI